MSATNCEQDTAVAASALTLSAPMGPKALAMKVRWAITAGGEWRVADLRHRAQ